MDPLQKGPILPVNFIVLLGLNIVMAVLAYCGIMLWGLIR
jgi:hypothetical protein